MFAEVIALAPVDLLVREPQTWRFQMPVIEALDVGRDFRQEIGTTGS
jgi:hypothetical protein